jgi:hypothetical protein
MYKLSKDPLSQIQNQIIRLSDNAFIPMDEANTDYQVYLKWISDGNEPLPAENT